VGNFFLETGGAPRPRALVLFTEQAAGSGILQRFGPIRLVRQMMGVALVALLAFIVLNTAHVWVDDLGLQGAGDLLTGQILWLAAAALGASFAMLFRIPRPPLDRRAGGRYTPRLRESRPDVPTSTGSAGVWRTLAGAPGRGPG
jgi:hypothetical protein